VGGLDPARWRAVCVLPERGPLTELLEEAGAEVVTHPLAVLRRGDVVGPLRAIHRDRRELAALASGAALVHSNTSVVMSGQALGRPSLIHVREIWPRPPVLWPLMRRRLLRADALACISQPVLEQFGGSPKARLLADGLARLPEPPDRTTARERLGLPQHGFVAAYIGRLSAWKGQDVFAEAIAQLDGAVGVVAGAELPGSGHAEALDRQAERLGIEERLIRLGFVDAVDELLGAADAVVVPSKRPEPLGQVAMEAAAAGVPVVATSAGGLAEFVREAKAGALVPPGDAGAVATALRAIAGESVELGGLPERFSRERMVSELQALYDELAR
jgi:glycosyltransferase involved in cell wall biosynthesis